MHTRFTPRSTWFGITLILLFGLTLPAFSQRYLGGIQGEIADASGAKVPGATVTVVNQIVTELENDFGSPDGLRAQKIMSDEIISKLSK